MARKSISIVVLEDGVEAARIDNVEILSMRELTSMLTRHLKSLAVEPLFVWEIEYEDGRGPDAVEIEAINCAAAIGILEERLAPEVIEVIGGRRVRAV